MSALAWFARMNEPEWVLSPPNGLCTTAFWEAIMSSDSTPSAVTYKDIPGFIGYRVGSDGTVWTCRRKGGNDRSALRLTGVWRQLKTHLHARYVRVNLVRNGANVSCAVHCLVLEAFVGPRPAGMEGCHYPDSDRTNNHVDNLRWDTHAENVRDRFRDRAIPAEKTCRRCGMIKPLASFPGDRRARDGRQAQCRPCHAELAWKTRDREAQRRRNREYMRRMRCGNR